MSMHKIPLTDLEREGLNRHYLMIDSSSQLSDGFRLGMKWAQDNAPQSEWISVDDFTPTEHCYVHAYCNDIVNGWVELLKVYVCPEYGNYSFTELDGDDFPAIVTQICIVNEPTPPKEI